MLGRLIAFMPTNIAVGSSAKAIGTKGDINPCLPWGFRMSLNRVIRGSFWLYVSGIASNLLGYFYWLMASWYVPSTTIGDASAITGVVSLISGLVSLGIASGATRLFGKAAAQPNGKQGLSSWFSSSLAAALALYASAAAVTAIVAPLFGMTQLQLPFVVSLIALAAFPQVANPLYNATLRTGVIALSSIVSALSRLALGLLLLWLGTGFAGVMLAFVIAGVAQHVVLGAALRGSISRAKPALSEAKEVIRQGIPAYLPSLVATAGSWLGILGIYAISGSADAGTYYIAFMIASIVYSLPLTLLGLMFPVISGMEDGRKRASARAVRLTSAIIAPLASVVLAYPHVPLAMMGTSYVSSSLALQILTLGCFAAPIVHGFNSLIYAYGKYRFVTALGFASNLPRVILYAPLVALWGDNGAAASYISGYVFSLTAVWVMSRRIGYSVGWGKSAVFAVVPASLSAAMAYAGLHWAIGAAIIFGVSYIAYARLGLVSKKDLGEVVSAFLSRKQLDTVYPYAKYVLEVMYGH